MTLIDFSVSRSGCEVRPSRTWDFQRGRIPSPGQPALPHCCSTQKINKQAFPYGCQTETIDEYVNKMPKVLFVRQ